MKRVGSHCCENAFTLRSSDTWSVCMPMLSNQVVVQRHCRKQICSSDSTMLSFSTPWWPGSRLICVVVLVAKPEGDNEV